MPDQSMISCPVCRREATRNERFCAGCGYPLTPSSDDKDDPLSSRLDAITARLDSRSTHLQTSIQERIESLMGKTAPRTVESAQTVASSFTAAVPNPPVARPLPTMVTGTRSDLIAGAAADIKMTIKPVDWIGYVRAFRGEPILQEIRIQNSGNVNYEQLCLSVDFLRFAPTMKSVIPVLRSGESVILSGNDLKPAYDLPAFRETSERVEGRITIGITNADGGLMKVENLDLPVFAYNECPVATEVVALIACFVQPMDPAIIEVTKLASRHQQTLNDSAAFCGYQNPDPVYIDNMVKAIYLAIQQDFAVKYINPPPSFEWDEHTLQRLRTPSQVILRERHGTCFDLSILFASCLEHIGLNPVVFLIRGHAFFGYYTEEMSLRDGPICTDWNTVAALLQQKKLVVVNSTNFAENGSYGVSKTYGERYLAAADKFRCLLDISAARSSGYKPMALEASQ